MKKIFEQLKNFLHKNRPAEPPIEDDTADLAIANNFKGNTEAIELYKQIKSWNRPKALSFLTDNDYLFVIFLYVFQKRIKDFKEFKNYLKEPYNYDVEDWGSCIDYLNSYVLFNKTQKPNLKEMKKNNIKKVKLLCAYNENCNYSDKLFNIDNVPEIPIENCPHNYVCRAVFAANLDFDD